MELEELGWTRLAYLHVDISDFTVNCPLDLDYINQEELELVVDQSVVVVIVHLFNIHLVVSVTLKYVHGRVVGYQYGSTDAVDTRQGYIENINSYYVDGVSITCGSP